MTSDLATLELAAISLNAYRRPARRTIRTIPNMTSLLPRQPMLKAGYRARMTNMTIRLARYCAPSRGSAHSAHYYQEHCQSTVGSTTSACSISRSLLKSQRTLAALSSKISQTLNQASSLKVRFIRSRLLRTANYLGPQPSSSASFTPPKRRKRLNSESSGSLNSVRPSTAS